MTDASPRPAAICAQLLQAMGASEGRRRRRKRNTTPDALGMAIKRQLLEAAIAADPGPDAFEGWLFQQVQAAEHAGQAGPDGQGGATRAMALQVRDEWHDALHSVSFRAWLAAGAPSEDERG